MRADVHQHHWSEPLLEALEQREELPFVRREGSRLVLHSAGELPYTIDTSAQASRAWHRRDGIDLALIALSSPVGIEALPRPEARRLIDAHLEGVAALGGGFAAWGPIPLDQPDPADVDDVLERGCLGLSLPAGAVSDPAAVRTLAPVLERAAARGAPVFIHPGPGADQSSPPAPWNTPAWWSALTGYVAQMQAAWLALVSEALPCHPELTLVFALLAGGAPLLAERLALRGGPEVDLADARVLYDTSGHGPAAVEAVAGKVGAERLLYGSDRPVVAPLPTPLDDAAQLAGGRFVAERLPTEVVA